MRVIAFAVALLLSKPLLACSVCGCDPAAGTLGLDRPGVHSLRLAIEDRYFSKESGAGDGAESERENRLLLRTQFAPLERLVVHAELPWYVFKRHLNALGEQDDNATGIGEVTLAARYELLRVGIEARNVVAVIGQLKLPTGPNARHLPGEGAGSTTETRSSARSARAGRSATKVVSWRRSRRRRGRPRRIALPTAHTTEAAAGRSFTPQRRPRTQSPKTCFCARWRRCRPSPRSMAHSPSTRDEPALERDIRGLVEMR